MTSPSLPPYAPAPGEPPFDEATRRSHRRRKQPSPWRQWVLNPWLVVAALTVLACAGILIYLAQRDDGPARTDAGVPVVPITTTAQAAPAVPPVPGADLPEGAISGDGAGDRAARYEVPRDIEPGRYSTAGALDPNDPPRWDRRIWRSSVNGTVSEDSDTGVGPQTVILKRGDVFETEGYKPWHRGP